MEDILPQFWLSIIGFSSFGGFLKILTVASLLPQSCPGTGMEDICQSVPTIPSRLEKHQEPHSRQGGDLQQALVPQT